jgi:peptidoglycan hydrolase CwlO-like protein
MDFERASNWIAGGGATALGGVLAWAAKWYHGKLYESMEQRVREAVMQATIDLKNDLSDFGGRVSSLEAHQEDMKQDVSDLKSTWEKVHMDIQNLPQRVVEAMRK